MFWSAPPGTDGGHVQVHPGRFSFDIGCAPDVIYVCLLKKLQYCTPTEDSTRSSSAISKFNPKIYKTIYEHKFIKSVLGSVNIV